MSTETSARQPKGVPTGGQFAPTTHSEPAVALPARVTPFHDADGTDWEFGGDEYTDVYNNLDNGFEVRITTDIREGGARAKVVDFRGSRPLVISDQTHFGSLDEAKAHAKEIRKRARGYGHNNISEGSLSPWGKIQDTSPMAAGIDSAWTAGHGGVKLSPERDEEVDPAWREPAGWYEQDCAWSKAVITHHRDLNPVEVVNARITARRWYPDEYEAIIGKDPAKYGLANLQPITAAESHIIEGREFLKGRAGTHDKDQSVTRDLDTHPGMVAVVLSDIPADGIEKENEPATRQRTILVPEGKWKLAYTEKLTLPKTDKYKTVEPADA